MGRIDHTANRDTGCCAVQSSHFVEFQPYCNTDDKPMIYISAKCVSILFADDTTILFEENNIHSIVTSLNYELDQLIIWLNANKLSINVSKTHYMVFHHERRKIDHEDIILNNNILRAHCTNFVGIIMDDKLKWANHIFD